MEPYMKCTQLVKRRSTVALHDKDQPRCIPGHCNYAPQWLRCRHSIPIITSDSQTHIFITCVARAISPCLPRWLPVVCRVKKEKKNQLRWNWYLPGWRLSICLKGLKQKRSESRAWTVWQKWQRKMHVSGKDFVKTGEEMFRLGFYNITLTSSTLWRGHPGCPEEGLLVAFKGDAPAVTCNVLKLMVPKCITLPRNTNMPCRAKLVCVEMTTLHLQFINILDINGFHCICWAARYH